MSPIERELTLHARALRSLARLLVGEAAADDLMQDAALQVVRCPPPAGAPVRGWLFGVLRRRASALRRGERRRRAREGAAAAAATSPPTDQAVEHRETVQRLHRALMGLPEPYLGTLLQRFFADLPPGEIAARTGTPLATIKSRLQRGLALLRAELDRDDDRAGGWRGALIGAFDLASWIHATAAAAAPAAGVLLMATTLKLVLGVGAAAAAIAWLAWDLGAPSTSMATADAAPAMGRSVAAESDAATAADAAGDPASAGADRRTVATAAPPPIRLRLVDADGGAPLPRYAIAVERPHEAGSVTFVTDDQGRLTLVGDHRTERLWLRGIDDLRHGIMLSQIREFGPGEWPAADAEAAVPFLVGPTYDLLFDALPAADAELVALLRCGDGPELRDSGRTHVRAGQLPWVRFDPQDANPSALGTGPWTLTIRSTDGLWWAAGAVRTARGRQPEPVAMRAHQCGVLAVHLGGIGVDDIDRLHAHVAVYRLGDDGMPLPQGRSEPFGRRDTVRVGCLEPGRHRLWIGMRNRDPLRRDVDVPAGAPTVVDVDIAPLADAGEDLRVLIRSASGRLGMPGVTLTAKRPDGSDLRHARLLAQERMPAARMFPGVPPAPPSPQYVFEALPAGEWIVRLLPTPQVPPFDRTEQRVRADAGQIEFVCQDAGAPPPAWCSVHATLPDGAPAVFAGITAFVDGQQVSSAQANEYGQSTLGPFVDGQLLHILVRAGGCLPEWITATMTAVTPPETLRVELHPGWGTLVHVSQPHDDTTRPLPGVEVLADGLVAGTTDELGALLLRGVEPPARLQFHLAGFELVYADVDAAGAPEAQEQWPHIAIMQPRRPR